MNLGDLTGLVEKPFAAVSNLVNTPNSAGRYRPFYLRNLLDAVQGRTLHDAVFERPRIARYVASGRRLPFNNEDLFRHYPELDR